MTSGFNPSTCSRWLVVCVGVLCASAAQADRTAAKPHIDAATAAYAAGKYDEAASELERAYVLDPDPALIYARAQALRLGGKCGDAIALYREYLATNPNEQQSETTRTHLAACEQAVKTQPPEPVVTEVPAEPPPVQTASPPPTTQPAAVTDTPRWYMDPIGGALAIGGTVAIGVGFGFLIASNNSRDDARSSEFRVDAVRHLDDATLERRIGIVAIGAGATLVAGGILRYLSLRADDSAPLTISVTPREVTVIGRF